MTARYLLTPALLALLLIFPAHADTNTAGEEITILEDSETGDSVGSLLLSTGNETFLPDSDTAGSNETTPAAPIIRAESSAGLWQRIKNGYGMPELNAPETAVHESWYASRPEYVKRMVGRSQKYLYHIVEEVQKRGMPTEIALLPMVESAFNPKAYSTSKASGIWQFIPSTGKNFGLQQNWWVDNRRDVTAATDAALTYLQKLHVMFGTWDLALAAYNAGEGTVMRAIERNRKKGLPTDYQSLNLPAETKNYVPKLQAVKNIVTHPERYGLEIQHIPNQPYFTRVNAPKQIDASLAARLAGVSLDEFVSLNPEYNRPVLTATDDKHEILLPMGADETFATNLAAYDKPLVSWQTYHAKRGERLDSIAKKFGVSPVQLREANDIRTKGKLKSARPLMVPAQDGAPETAFATEEPLMQAEAASNDDIPTSKRHIVKKGETLGAIARRYDISSRQLLADNHLKTSRLKKGQILVVQLEGETRHAKSEQPGKTAKTRAASQKTHYVVRRGDTLEGIARKFDVATNDLQRWNNLRGTRIMPGRKLTILKTDAA